MSSLFRSRTTAVAAGAALLVGLGSVSAVAADMVGSGGIRNGSVRSIDIQDESIRSVDINNGGVHAEDLPGWVMAQLQKAGTAGPRGAKGATGTDGAAGPAGETGPAGPAGETGPAGSSGEFELQSDSLAEPMAIANLRVSREAGDTGLRNAEVPVL